MTNVIWSKKASHELEVIIEYWQKRNKSFTYSHRILSATDDAVKLIRLHSGIGIETNHRNIKMRLVLNRFYIVYRKNQDLIEILKFWDCRQDPKSNPYLK